LMLCSTWTNKFGKKNFRNNSETYFTNKSDFVFKCCILL